MNVNMSQNSHTSGSEVPVEMIIPFMWMGGHDALLRLLYTEEIKQNAKHILVECYDSLTGLQGDATAYLHVLQKFAQKANVARNATMEKVRQELSQLGGWFCKIIKERGKDFSELLCKYRTKLYPGIADLNNNQKKTVLLEVIEASGRPNAAVDFACGVVLVAIAIVSLIGVVYLLYRWFRGEITFEMVLRTIAENVCCILGSSLGSYVGCAMVAELLSIFGLTMSPLIGFLATFAGGLALSYGVKKLFEWLWSSEKNSPQANPESNAIA